MAGDSIVDHAPPDDATASVAGQFAGVRYIVEKCAGLDFPRNRAWVEAHGEWIAYLDDDVTVDRWCSKAFKKPRENQDASAFTGLIMPLELSSRAGPIREATCDDLCLAQPNSRRASWIEIFSMPSLKKFSGKAWKPFAIRRSI